MPSGRAFNLAHDKRRGRENTASVLEFTLSWLCAETAMYTQQAEAHRSLGT